MENVIIIGSGPAAWTAAIYAARAAMTPLIFEGAITSENQVNGTLPMGQLALTSEVENFPGFPPGDIADFLATSIPEDRQCMLAPRASSQRGVTGPELVELVRAQAIHCGARTLCEDVVRVDFSQKALKTVIASDGKTYTAKAVIIATGARANYLGLPSEEAFKNRGVSACATCDGALPRFRNKGVAIIGGGDSAVEEACHIAKFAATVYLVHRRDQLRASKAMVQRAMTHPKIELVLSRIPKEIIGNDKDGVTGIALTSTASDVGAAEIMLDVTGVFVAIGHTPNTAFLGGALTLTDKGFVARPMPFRTNTSVGGVFVAGDVADDHYRQACTAAATGCMAALDAERYLAE